MVKEGYIQWCNENEGRFYPLNDDVSGVSDLGQDLPFDIIADLGLLLPPEYEDPYITGVRFTSNIISVAIGCSIAPLFVLSLNRLNYTPYTAVALSPLVENASGWIVFGAHRYTTTENYTFSSPVQSKLNLRTVRYTAKVPVQRFFRFNGSNNQYLEKLVNIVGLNDLKIYRDPNNAQKLIVELDKTETENYLGPCDQYVDNNGCNVPPICEIAGVPADSDGVIRFVFTGTY